MLGRLGFISIQPTEFKSNQNKTSTSSSNSQQTRQTNIATTMDPDLLPSLVNYYQAAQCTKELGYKVDIKRHQRHNARLQAKLTKEESIQQDLRAQIEELKLALSKETATSGVRQKEIESLRARYHDNDKADKALASSLKIQADSYKREIREIKDDLKTRESELRDLRDDLKERDSDLKDARDLTRTREKELKEVRDQLRARDSEIRKANHALERVQTDAQRLEMEAQEAQDALEASKEALKDVQRRKPVEVKTRPKAASPVAAPVPVSKPKASKAVTPPPESPSPSVAEPLTDYTAPPAKPVPAAKKKVPSTANKENVGVPKKRKAKIDDFSASPPMLSPAVESPKRRKVTKSEFSMTPFINKAKKMDIIPLSPPSSKTGKKDLRVAILDDATKKKPKKKLLGGVKTLMDDTPKAAPKVKNFGKELSPLKRPKSSAGLILSSK